MRDGSGVYVATESFSTEIDGEHYAVVMKKTRVREGHPLLEQNRNYFKPVEENVTYDLETATAAPGESRGGPGKDDASSEADSDDDETAELSEPVAETEPVAEPDGTPSSVEPLEGKSRAELNELAVQLGVEDPDKLQNKPAVEAAIEAARSAE